jgi:hypothetical protein
MTGPKNAWVGGLPDWDGEVIAEMKEQADILFGTMLAENISAAAKMEILASLEPAAATAWHALQAELETWYYQSIHAGLADGTGRQHAS